MSYINCYGIYKYTWTPAKLLQDNQLYYPYILAIKKNIYQLLLFQLIIVDYNKKFHFLQLKAIKS